MKSTLENPSEPTHKIIVGAIRWDAWFGELSDVGLMVEKTLGPSHWHRRLPFFARELSDTRVHVRANSQAIMDEEIHFACTAGLDYWAFVIYPPEDPLSLGLKLYLSSTKKSKIKFCLNLQGGWLGSESDWLEKVRLYVHHFQEPTYQRVMGNRPLVYLFAPADMLGPGKFGSLEFARQAFDELRAASQAAGAGNLYLVLQDWSPAIAHDYVIRLGGDAVSAYAADGRGKAAAYTDLAAHTQCWWDSFRATGSPVVPLVTSGWDPRPRIEIPTPWHDYGSAEYFYDPPSPAELADHLAAALNWVRTYPETAEAQAVLIYAWNEFDEGGWLTPMLFEGTARLDALQSVLAGR